MRTARRVAGLVHGVQNTTMYRLEAVTDVRQGARDDNAHGVFQERSLHFLAEVCGANDRAFAAVGIFHDAAVRVRHVDECIIFGDCGEVAHSVVGGSVLVLVYEFLVIFLNIVKDIVGRFVFSIHVVELKAIFGFVTHLDGLLKYRGSGRHEHATE